MAKNTRAKDKGFTILELAIVLAITIITTAITIPATSSMLYHYRLRAAVSAATWGIQSTRFQALEKGYPYQVVFNGTSSGGSTPVYNNPTYQITNEVVGATTFSNVGTSLPISGSPVTLNTPTTLQFSPNGSVSATTGSLSFTITYQGTVETITVSNYGNIDVTP